MGSSTKDANGITRRKAQQFVAETWGPRAFARKSTKTAPGQRFEVGFRRRDHKVKVIGRGETWKAAAENAHANIQTALTNKDGAQ